MWSPGKIRVRRPSECWWLVVSLYARLLVLNLVRLFFPQVYKIYWGALFATVLTWIFSVIAATGNGWMSLGGVNALGFRIGDPVCAMSAFIDPDFAEACSLCESRIHPISLEFLRLQTSFRCETFVRRSSCVAGVPAKHHHVSSRVHMCVQPFCSLDMRLVGCSISTHYFRRLGLTPPTRARKAHFIRYQHTEWFMWERPPREAC